MKKIVVAVLVALLSTSALACDPIGWRLVYQKQISVSERVCIYEKSGARVQIIVDGFCPFDPC